MSINIKESIGSYFLACGLLLGLLSATELQAQTSVNNAATVSAPATVIDPVPGNNTDDVTTPVVPQNPALTLVKTGTLNDGGDGIANAGDTIIYAFSVTNTGNVTLTNVTLTDPLVTLAGGPIASLAVGATDSTTFTASYTLTQADIDNGSFENIATATSDEGATDQDNDVQTFAANPTLQLVKTGTLNDGGDGQADAGDTISYAFSVTNTGNVTLTNVTLTDPLVTVAGGPIASLAVGATDSTTFTASYTLTQADIDNGSFENIATATSDEGATDQDNDVQTFAANPTLQLVKTGTLNDGGDGQADAGDTISYAFSVTNTGNVTLTNVTLTDPLVTVAGGPIASLAVGATDSTTFTASYTLTQADIDAGTFTNTATATSDEGASDQDSDTQALAANPALTITKTQTGGPNPVTADGDVIDYTIVVENTGNVTQTGVSTTDVLPDGSAGTLSGPVESITGDGQLEVGETWTYTISYTVTQADVDAGVDLVNTASVVTNQVSGPTSDDATTPVQPPQVNVVKTSNPVSGTEVTAGQTITYTLTATVSDAALTADLVLTDTLGAGQTFGAVTGSGAYTANTAGNPLTFTLPSGTVPGTYAVEYTVTVDNDATGSVSNNVVATGGGDPDPECPSCTTSHPLADPVIVATKSSDPVSGTEVTAGQTITYTVTATVTDAALTADLVLTDTLGSGLTFGAVTVPGAFTANTTGNPLTFTLPSGTVPGSYSVEYTATVDADATGTVGNSVVATGGGDPDPECPSCTTNHPIADPVILATKSSDPMDGSTVAAGDTITYTLSATITDAALTADLVLTDTLGAGLTFGAVTVPGAYTANTAGNPLTFTLPSGTVPGIYAVEYTATVDPDATGNVGNNMVPTGGGDPDPECPSCTTSHPLADPVIVANKASNPASGSQVLVGQTITYALTATVSDAALTSPLVLSDTLGAGLSFGAVTVPGAFSANTAGNPLTFTLPTGTVPGSYSVEYTATVAAGAEGTSVGNNVVPTGGGDPDPECPNCTTSHPVGDPSLNLVKSASLNDDNGNTFADVGEVIDYTLTATNDGDVTLTDVEIVDPLIGALSCTPAQPTTLAPAAQLVCTGSYTVTQADVDAGGSVTNTATVTAPDPFDPINNPPLTDTDSTSTPVVPQPLLTLIKIAVLDDTNGNTFADVGEDIDYTLTATNDGNIALTDVEIVDPLIGALVCTPAQPAALAPTEQLVCTGSYTVSQADLDNGPDIVNVATVAAPDPIDPINNPPLGDSDTETVPTEFNPLIDLAKVITGGDPYANVGDFITYQLTATNNGTVTLDNVVITDPQATVGACTPAQPASLAPSDTIVCPAFYEVTQADIDAGTFSNTAIADGDDPNGDPVSDSDTAVATATQNPALVTAKILTGNDDADASGNVSLGDTLTYTVTATNTGNQTLTNVLVTDTLITPSSAACPSVAPGGSCVLTGTYVVTQADVDVGQIDNIGTGDSDQTPPDDDTVTVPVAQNPAIQLVKAGTLNDGGDGIADAGDTISYAFTVTNTGDVTLTNIVLNDPLVTVAGGPIASLAVGASDSTTFTASYTVTQADIDAGTFTNTATAASDEGANDDDEDTQALAASPLIQLGKVVDAGSPYASVGDVIDYTLTATNTGNVTLSNVTIVDPQATVGSCTPAQPASLAPGAVLVCNASYTVTQADLDTGSFSNTATASGQDPSTTPVSDDDTAVALATQTPALDVVKTIDAGDPYAVVGDVIDYTITATNSGNVTLASVSISDPQATIGTCAPVQPTSLAPGAALVCDASYTVTQADLDAGTFTNTATGSGFDPIGDPVSDSDQATATATQNGLIDLVKSIDSGSPYASTGDVIGYTLTATNTGNVTLDNVSISDPQATIGTCTPAQPASLVPGAALICDASYTVTQADIDAGSFTNTATVNGEDPANNPVSDDDSATAIATQTPALNLVKAASLNDANSSGFADAGETIDYTLTTTNTGNVTLAGVQISDPLIGALSCTPAQPATLAPSAQLVCTGSYTVTPGDVAAGGSITNTATTTAPDPVDPINNPPLTDTDSTSTPVVPQPLLTLIKIAVLDDTNGNTFADVGEDIDYTLTATNDGNIALTDVEIVDPLIGALVCTPAQPAALAPTEQLVCTGSYTVSQADLDNGPDIVNVATVAAPDPIDPINNPPLGDSDTETVPTEFNPLIDLAKVITGGDPYANVGDFITYQLTATNNGTVTLDNVVITDPQATVGACTPAQPASLAPSDTIVCPAFYEVTQADIDAGTFSNTAIADGDDPNGDPVSDSDTAVAAATQSPALLLDKVLLGNDDADGSGNVTLGDTLTYGLVATNSGNVTLGNVTIVDPLIGALSCTPAQPATLSPTAQLTCSGTYVVQQGDVDAGSIVNTGTADSDLAGPVQDIETVAVVAPEVVANKASNPPTGSEVVAGQTITYTLSARVSDAPLTAPLVLSDTLSAGLSFGAVTANPGGYSANTAGNPLTFSLPSGTPAGTYTISYTATVDADAAGTLGNLVVPTGGGDPDPECPSCTTSHPLADPVIVANKASNPASGTEVTAGQTITYTLTATVSDAALTADLDLTDTLGAGLTFGSVTSAGAFSANTAGNPLLFTLPSGTVPGTYSVEYTATVDQDAAGNVGNNVIAAGGGDPDPECPSCSTSHPLADPVIVANKASNPASGTEVTAGQTITYTLTATVSDAALSSPLILTDTLGSGLSFGAVTVPGAFIANTAGNPLLFTLPSGTVPGTYSVEYTATVDQDAAGNVGNNVIAAGGGDPDPECPSCTTSHPLADPVVVANKASNPASGTEVTAGQTITYTVTATVSDAALTADLVLTDTLGAGLTFGAVTVPGGFTPDVTGAPVLTFTLPSGTVPGTYAVEYTATVDADASGNVGNSVIATGGGDPDPECPTCTTSHPLADPVIVATKSSDPVSGTEVTAGQTITYTVTATVTDAALTADLVLTDTLGAGLTFGAVTVPGGFTPDVTGAPVLTFTLPSGAVPGTYAVEYTATVDADASGNVGNSVIATGGGDPDPECPSCTTSHPLADPVVVANKASNPASGAEVTAGQTITYTVTATVSDAALTADLVLTDTLGAGLTFGSVTNAGGFTPDVSGAPVLTFTLPSGTVPGTYAVEYTATVDQDAAGNVGNNVIATGGGDPDPECPSCTTSHPLADPVIVANKSSDPASGTEVTAGQTITYTLTATVTDAALTADLDLTDTLGAGLTFGAVTVPGAYTANTTGNPLTFTLPSGTVPGTYAVEYTATVDADATGTVGNSVVATGGGDPDPECPSCTTTHTVRTITLDKNVVGLNATGPNTWRIEFEIVVDNPGTTPVDYTLTDTLGFTTTGLQVGNTGFVSTAGGTLNPALASGQFTPAIGVPLQVSDLDVTIAAGQTHRYSLIVPFGVVAGQLEDNTCTGAPDDGLYNLAEVSGLVPLSADACASIDEGGDVAIQLVKTVELGVDFDGNAYGDVGDVLFYEFTITNTGAQPLTEVQLIDLLVDDLQCLPRASDGEPIDVLPHDAIRHDGFERGGLGTLNPAATVSCSATHELTAQDVARRRVENTATALGAGPNGEVVSSVSTAVYTAFQ